MVYPVIVWMLTVVAGCAAARSGGVPGGRPTLQRRAMDCLRSAVRYGYNPAVRVEAVEALESVDKPGSRPWIRAALLDAHPGVRFAACVAIGRLRDTTARRALVKRVNDDDCSVQVAALFALHRLGDETRTGRLPNYLSHDHDVAVRRNAAFVLGLMGEPTAIKILARAMKDPDFGVRQHALEAMARLQNREARQELTFMTNAGIGSEEVFAIVALAETEDPEFIDTFRYKLARASHLETRLASARGLGRLGSDEGFSMALHTLRRGRELVRDPHDPAPEQILRAKQMAASALGAIGRLEALPALADLMNDNTDPRVQVSAARAILEILDADRMRSIPFAVTNHRGPE